MNLYCLFMYSNLNKILFTLNYKMEKICFPFLGLSCSLKGQILPLKSSPYLGKASSLLEGNSYKSCSPIIKIFVIMKVYPLTSKSIKKTLSS